MPLYFFHVRNGLDTPDVHGTELPDLDAARAEGACRAGAMLNYHAEEFWNDKEWELTVTDKKPSLRS